MTTSAPGNIVALASSAFIHAAFSLASPQNYDFVSVGQIEMMEDDKSGLDDADFTTEFLDEAKAWIQRWGWGFNTLMVAVWPVLSLPAGVFTNDYWVFCVFISIIWSFVATFTIIVLPIYESMDAIYGVCMFLVGKKAEQPSKEGAAPPPRAGLEI